jgi:hypothetical protein
MSVLIRGFLWQIMARASRIRAGRKLERTFFPALS